MLQINKRDAAMDAALQHWVDKFPTKVKLMGDGSNSGVGAGAIVKLTEAAKGPYFMLLERDFHVRPCILGRLSSFLPYVSSTCFAVD